MSVTQKLLLINSLICVAFIIMIMVVFLSFRHVEKVLTTTFVTETGQIIENANLTRELSRLLWDMNLILQTFYEKSEDLKIQGESLSRGTEALLAKVSDQETALGLKRFTRYLNGILQQCQQVNSVRKEITNIEKRFDDSIILLDNIIADRLVETIVEGGDTSDLEQLSSMIGGWRESFIRMKLSFVQLGLEHFKHPMEEHGHPLISHADDLQLRLRTLTAAAPDIADQGRKLMALLIAYKVAVVKFHRTVAVLGEMQEEKHRAEESVLLMMERSDKRIATKSEKATKTLTEHINRSLMINLIIFLAILPMVILGGITAYSIKEPIRTVVEYIRRLSKGDLPEAIIEDKYQGEFAQVMVYLNQLIQATDSVTQIAESIVSGNMDVLVLERSGNDRLMQALNRMIQRLDGIIRETQMMIRSVEQGSMDVRGNAEAFEGGWQELVGGVNHLIDARSRAISKSVALSQEMDLARNIQTCLLPVEIKKIHPDFEIAATMVPADRVGGDFYEITRDGFGALRIAIGDVSGHGITPGLIMMMAHTVHSTVIGGFDSEARDAVIHVNRILFKNVHGRLKKNHFMTFNALRYLGGGNFEQAGAHLRIVVYRRKKEKCELIRTKGVYLNFKKDISKHIHNSYFTLGEGDIMVLYTDGLTEAQNHKGELLDMERFINFIEKHAVSDPDPDSLKEKIMADVMEWCGDRREDDMTLMIVKRRGKFNG